MIHFYLLSEFHSHLNVQNVTTDKIRNLKMQLFH